MPKKNAPDASAGRDGHARRRRRLRPIGKPEPHHRESTELKLPIWLPQPVAAHARQVFTNNCRTESDRLLLRRLTSDLRMKGVWTELLKRKRFNYKSSKAFIYPATSRMDWSPTVRTQRRRAQTLRRMPSTVNEAEAKELELYAIMNQIVDDYTWDPELPIQDRALVAFFDQAFEFARSDSRPVPRAIAKKKREYYLKMARRIRADAEEHNSIQRIGVVGLVGVGGVRERLPLLEAALAYEELANKAAPPSGHPLLVGRKRWGDERQTGFVLELVDATAAIFGKALRGIVAIVANVAFDCGDWTAERVRKTVIIPCR
jgi:hypothetical protein